MKYIALLRAINVSGSNIIKMETLKKLFVDIGMSSVVTYLQSGNVVFSTTSMSRTKLESSIESEILSQLRLSVKVLVRTGDDIEGIIHHNPFVKRNSGIEFLYTTIFKEPIEPIGVEKQLIKKEEREEYHITKQCIYLFCPNGFGRTKLNNANWEKWTKKTATTRNWKSILAIRDLMA